MPGRGIDGLERDPHPELHVGGLELDAAVLDAQEAPASVWIALRVDTPRTAMPSLAMNFSRETVNFNVDLQDLVLVGPVDSSIWRPAYSAGAKVSLAVDCPTPHRRSLRGARDADGGYPPRSHSGVGAHGAADPLEGVQHRRVVAAADPTADLGQALLGQLTGEVHGDLAGEGHGRPAVAREHRPRCTPNSSAAASRISDRPLASGAARAEAARAHDEPVRRPAPRP